MNGEFSEKEELLAEQTRSRGKDQFSRATNIRSSVHSITEGVVWGVARASGATEEEEEAIDKVFEIVGNPPKPLTEIFSEVLGDVFGGSDESESLLSGSYFDGDYTMSDRQKDAPPNQGRLGSSYTFDPVELPTPPSLSEPTKNEATGEVDFSNSNPFDFGGRESMHDPAGSERAKTSA